MPSKRVSTGPRKYISAGAGAGPSKRIRIAIESSLATSAIEPIFIVFESPVFEMPSCGTPQSGPMRGKSRNSSAITGAPRRAVRAARPPACFRLGWPTGMWARTTAVSRPHTDTSIATATGSDCE